MDFFSRVARLGGFGGEAVEKDPNFPAIRIGILGAAQIAPNALIYPSKLNLNTVVVAVAARDETRTKAFAAKYGIPKTFPTYEALLADPDIDAIYIPSPNGLHYKWIIKALEAKKHVLCEKPLTANADEAQQVFEASIRHKRVLMDASHSFHHPAVLRAREIVRSGVLGDLVEVKAVFRIPFIPGSNIRYNVGGTQPHLAGGAFMDTGVYTSNCVRFLTDLKFKECNYAKAVEKYPGLDQYMEAELSFENSAVKGHVIASLVNPKLFSCNAEVVGTKGKLVVSNFVAPSVYHRIYLTDATGKTTTECVYKAPNETRSGRSSYEYQLDAFVKCVREQADGGPARTQAGGTLDDVVNTMKLIDAVYEKSGLGKRVGAGLD